MPRSSVVGASAIAVLLGCVESAVLAAKQFVYDAPDPTTLPFGVWTLPFEFEFSYRR